MGKHLIFTSLGDRQSILDTYEAALAPGFDLVSFFYGSRPEVRERAGRLSRVMESGKGGKMQALKSMWQRHAQVFAQYEAIWVCDADLVGERGDPRELADSLLRFNLSVISPAHSFRGKISHPVHAPVDGPHTLRIVNFVECNFPMFSHGALDRFMRAFDGSLTGFGTDWWYLNVLECNRRAGAAILDRVVVVNPRDEPREIDRLKSAPERQAEWAAKKAELGFEEWPVRTLHFIY